MASSLMFIQCTSEPIMGPQGLAGIDGVNGNDGSDGVDGNTACMQCHTPGSIDAAKAEYSYSGHAAGGAVSYAGGRASCSQCHSNEGYINQMTGMPAVDIAFPTAITCKTCHAIHNPESIAQGDTAYNLRNTSELKLMISSAVGKDIFIDYGNSSNGCITCHQPRKVSTLAGKEDTGTFKAPSHWGPHYGLQSTFLEGIQGEEIPGSMEYPKAQSKHRTGASCVSCHMGETKAGKGGHSWKPNLNNCTGCHNDGAGAPKVVFGYAEKMIELETLLVSRNVLLGDPGDYHVNEESNISVLEAKAAWNWITLHEDGSKGIHNPAYAKALLQNSIEALD